MQLHRGRLIDHLHLVVADIEASRRFYTAIFATLDSVGPRPPDLDEMMEEHGPKKPPSTGGGGGKLGNNPYI